MTVLELASKLPLTVINAEADRPVTGVFCCDLLSVAMAKAPENFAWVTVIGNVNAVAVASLTDTACIILAEGFSFDEEAVSAAGGKVTLMRSELPIYETAAFIAALL